jgi:hypothetical protein
MKHLTIKMVGGCCHSVPYDDSVSPYTAFKTAIHDHDLDFMNVDSYEVIEKIGRKRVEVDVTVNMILEMPEDIDAETVVKDGSFDDFTVYISEDVKRSMKFPRELNKGEIEADQISIEGVDIVNEDELA